MGKKLLITEKPSVAMEFAKALKINTNRKNGYLESEDWIITWCVGHLVTMSYPEKYDEKLKYWRLDTLPFIPTEWKYEIIPAVQNQFNIVQSLMQREDIDVIYNAGDSGREGEYIQRLVVMMAHPNPKAEMKRVWIDSQTEEEIQRGIREAKYSSEYDSLSDSAYLRAKEDYLIGINFSRLLSIIYGRTLATKINEEKASISVGRVMTCVLGMIVSREREIRNFVKTKYYKIVGEFGDENSSFKAEWKVNEKSKVFESIDLYNDTGFKDEKKARDFIVSLQGKDAIITELKKSKQKENPPLLFNLAEIQNECTKRFKIKPDETLEIIQNLYEKKLVTYPRTDARVLSTAVAKEISKNLNGITRGYKDEEVQGYLKKMIEEKYPTNNLTKTKYVNDSKITDHYAIIPTGQGYENYDKLPDLQKQVYKVIVKRFLAIFYPPAEYNKIQVTVNVENETFYASGKVCLNQGYLEILKPVENKKSADNNEKGDNSQNTNLDILKNLKKGQKINVVNYETKEAETSPPSRYNSGSIILAMENAGKLIEEEELREQIKGAGIGTSATRAEIMKKLEKIKYIQINSKTQIITPTEKGEIIYDIVNSSMPDMLNPKLTASWEKGLDMVAKKEIQPNEFMTKLTNYIHSKFNKLVVKW
ncbi:MAG: DNA topoisomerase III [Clostridia bacterium]